VQRIAFAIIVALLSTGCASSLETKARWLGAGSTPADVVTRLGEPLRKDARDADEAWQYCSTGALVNSYATVWLRNQVVHAVSTQNRIDLEGECKKNLREVDWATMPVASKPPQKAKPKTFNHGVPN